MAPFGHLVVGMSMRLTSPRVPHMAAERLRAASASVRHGHSKQSTQELSPLMFAEDHGHIHSCLPYRCTSQGQSRYASSRARRLASVAQLPLLSPPKAPASLSAQT